MLKFFMPSSGRGDKAPYVGPVIEKLNFSGNHFSTKKRWPAPRGKTIAGTEN